MAETKTTSTRGRKPSEVKTTTNADTELEQAKAENAQLSDMLKQMQQQLLAMQAQIDNSKNATTNVVVQQNDVLTKTFKVISLLPNVYNLTTQPYGRGGKVYTFRKFGDYNTIKYADMQDILSLSLHQFEKGYAVLSSKKDYEDLGIGYIFDEVRDMEKMERLVSLQDENSVDIILSMEEDMRDNVCNLIARKIAEGFSYDYNMIKELEDEGCPISEIADLVKASSSEQ